MRAACRRRARSRGAVTGSQIKKLFFRFQRLDKNATGVITCAAEPRRAAHTRSGEDFLSIPELAINPLVDRMLAVFGGGCGAPRGRRTVTLAARAR